MAYDETFLRDIKRSDFCTEKQTIDQTDHKNLKRLGRFSKCKGDPDSDEEKLMHKDEVQKHIEQHLAEGDELIGFFQATYTPSLWWFVLVGPLMFAGVRSYFIGVSKQGIYFYKLTFVGKFQNADFFKYDEIKSAKLGKGFMARPMVFRFANGKKLKVKGQLKGIERIAKLTPEVSDYIRNNIAAPK